MKIQYEEYKYEEEPLDNHKEERSKNEEVINPEEIEDLPFCQLFRVGPDMCLLIDHVAMCPDEMAFIRVVDNEGYTPVYKRKIKRDKVGDRFIVFNNTNYYLDDNKTRPVVDRKEVK